MECHDARSLIQSYLDGELSQAQAAPLRSHLLACQPCRAGAQDEKNLKRWFVAPAAVPVPDGFAARLARAAVHGESLPRRTNLTALPGQPVKTASRSVERDSSLLRFVLTCTAAAALLLFTLALGIRTLSLPQTDRLAADDRAEVQIDKVVEELEQLNRSQAGAAALPAPGKKRP